MARKVFFSFHYERDIWRTNVVRNSGIVAGMVAAIIMMLPSGEEAKKKGETPMSRN